jgi:hypothetical protein
MKNPEQFLKAAKDGVVTVVFEKINDGGTRIMECTLNPSASKDNVTAEMSQNDNNDHLAVWALDRAAWRSFRVSTVTEWYEGKPKCPHCNGDKTQPHKNCILR